MLSGDLINHCTVLLLLTSLEINCKCVVVECHTVGGMGYSFHHFPKYPAICSLWVKAVHNQRKNWKGPTDASLICSKHFELDCYEQYYREELGLPSKVEVPQAGHYSNYFPQASR